MLPVLCEPGWDPRQRLALGRATQPGPSASAGLHCTRHAQDSPRQVHASWQGKRSPPDSSNRQRKGSPTPITGEEASTSAVHPRGIGWWGDVEREGRCQAKALENTESTPEWPPAPSTGTPLRSSRPRGSGSPHPLQLCFHAPLPLSLGQTCFLHSPTHPWPREATAHHDSRPDLQAQAWLLCEPDGGISEPCYPRRRERPHRGQRARGPEPPAALALTEPQGMSSAPEEHPSHPCQSTRGAQVPNKRTCQSSGSLGAQQHRPHIQTPSAAWALSQPYLSAGPTSLWTRGGPPSPRAPPAWVPAGLRMSACGSRLAKAQSSQQV